METNDLMPRWVHVEGKLDDYIKQADQRFSDHLSYDNERYSRLESQLNSIDTKLDTLQSWTDNLKGRMVVVGVLIAFVGPAVVGAILKLL